MPIATPLSTSSRWIVGSDGNLVKLADVNGAGTRPSTNVLQYNGGNRCWGGVYAQDWGEPANPAAIEALQAIMAPISGPGAP